MGARALKVAVVEASASDTQKRPALPRSATVMAINFAGLGMFIAAIVWLRNFGRGMSGLSAMLISAAAYSLPIIVLEAVFLKNWRRPSAGFDFSRSGHAHYGRGLAKLIGFYATLGLALGIYAVAPEYHGSFYNTFHQMLRWLLPVVAVLAVPYFLILERYNRRPFDGYWQLSLLLRLKFRQVDRAVLGQHLLGWLVKAFYSPLMVAYCNDGINRLRSFNPQAVLFNFTSFYEFCYDSLYVFDVLIAVGAYLLTIRLLDSHLRSAEPTFMGWVVAVACYQPFWSVFEGNYLNYGGGGTPWGFWFSGKPTAYMIWGSIILVLTVVYVWATFSFGIRFSNLTNRGIITNGPYSFVKHPAYVSKNLAWWMIAMPFLSNVGWQEAVKHCLMLLTVNAIYFLRAKTEERHLSSDPDYVAYATAMEQRSLLRWVGRIFPALRYKPGRIFNVQPSPVGQK